MVGIDNGSSCLYTSVKNVLSRTRVFWCDLDVIAETMITFARFSIKMEIESQEKMCAGVLSVVVALIIAFNSLKSGVQNLRHGKSSIE